MTNVNIPDTEKIKLVCTHQAKGSGQPLRKMMCMVVPGKGRRGQPTRRWIDNNRGDMTKYELTAHMTEHRQSLLEHDGEDWPTKMWRLSLKVRKVRHNREKTIARTCW